MCRLLKIIAAFVCFAACCAPLAAQDILKEVDAKAAKLAEITRSRVEDWRVKVGDVPNAWDPALDDSSWRKFSHAEFTWGDGPVAWLRTTITLPREVAGISIAGTKVEFVCGCDDDGVIYVNDKEVGPFHWDQGRVVLTESAQPGQTFKIAIKNTNNTGPGRLLSANLEYALFAKVSDAVDGYIQAFRSARDLYAIADETKRAPYAKLLKQSIDSIEFGALTNDKTDAFVASIESAKSKLAGLRELAGDLTIHMVGHAHIDMNWLWLWPETIDVCKNTFGTMCNLMEEHPDFKFGQDQPAVYLAMQKHHPDIFLRIKEAIKKGQWDPIATNWTEADNNMSSGESIVRSIMYGKRYMKQQFGTESDICWQPDTFGHPWTLPQILVKSGIKYYYFARCGIGKPLFWWQGADGSKVLAFNYGWYNNGVGSGIWSSAVGFAKDTGVRDLMWVYGVGDHGGGPTRDMIDTAKKFQAEPGAYKIEFAKATDYYRKVEKQGARLPVWDGELNPTFQGCYTSHSDIKRWNRESENLLPCAEKFSAISTAFGGKYPTESFVESWRNTCFNQFHDLLCGSAIHGSYDYSRELYEATMSQGKSALDKSIDLLASRIKTKGGGIPVVVFNSLSWTRTDAVCVPTPFPGENTAVKVTGPDGKVYPARTIGNRLYFTARNVPAVGYAVFWVNRSSKPLPSSVKADGTTVENEFFRIVIDRKSGVISEIFDKKNGRRVMPSGGASALLQILQEEPRGMSAWTIGAVNKTEDLRGDCEVALMDSGPAKATMSIDHEYGESMFTQELTLYDGVPRIDIRMTADWQEKGGGDRLSPMLKVAFPTNLKNAKASFEIPFGSIERPADGAEVVAQKWIDLSGSDYGVSLLNDCKYGFDVNGSVLRATLLRTSYDPDPMPDQGVHEINYSLFPHKGDWKAAGTVRRSFELNEPLIARVVKPHQGDLPTKRSFVSISSPNTVVTALKQAEDDKSFVLRFYETNGQAHKATIKVNLPVRWYVETDLMERPVGKRMPVKNGAFTVSVGKHEIKTYKLLRG